MVVAPHRDNGNGIELVSSNAAEPESALVERGGIARPQRTQRTRPGVVSNPTPLVCMRGTVCSIDSPNAFMIASIHAQVALMQNQEIGPSVVDGTTPAPPHPGRAR
jgi:hypothetical protein